MRRITLSEFLKHTVKIEQIRELSNIARILSNIEWWKEHFEVTVVYK